MSGSVMVPIFLGFAVSFVVFLISVYVFKKNVLKATHLTLIASIVVLASSFVIGSWEGMGIGIVSFGMILSCILLYIFSFTLFKAYEPSE